jgi:hypothetical protein
MTALESDTDVSDTLDNDGGGKENRPVKGPGKIMYRGDNRSTRVLAEEEVRAMVAAGTATPDGRCEKNNGDDLSSHHTLLVPFVLVNHPII